MCCLWVWEGSLSTCRKVYFFWIFVVSMGCQSIPFASSSRLTWCCPWDYLLILGSNEPTWDFSFRLGNQEIPNLGQFISISGRSWDTLPLCCSWGLQSVLLLTTFHDFPLVVSCIISKIYSWTLEGRTKRYKFTACGLDRKCVDPF